MRQEREGRKGVNEATRKRNVRGECGGREGRYVEEEEAREEEERNRRKQEEEKNVMMMVK